MGESIFDFMDRRRRELADRGQKALDKAHEDEPISMNFTTRSTRAFTAQVFAANAGVEEIWDLRDTGLLGRSGMAVLRH